MHSNLVGKGKIAIGGAKLSIGIHLCPLEALTRTCCELSNIEGFTPLIQGLTLHHLRLTHLAYKSIPEALLFFTILYLVSVAILLLTLGEARVNLHLP